MRAQLQAADVRMIQEDEQPCCYSRSDKYWVIDPTGVAWETFHTLGAIPLYGENAAVFDHGRSTTPALSQKRQCCVPVRASEPKTDAEACRSP